MPAPSPPPALLCCESLVTLCPQIRTILQRTQGKNIILSFTEVGKKPPVFAEATAMAHTILNCGVEFDTAEIIYNRFK